MLTLALLEVAALGQGLIHSAGLAWEIAAARSAQDQACVEPPPGLVSWWSFDEVVDGTTPDILGSNPGVIVSDPVLVAGKVGNALSFDGGEDAVMVADSEDLRELDWFTIEAWVNPTSITETSVSNILGKVEGLEAAYSLRVLQNGQLQITFIDDQGQQFAFNGPFISNNEWVHIAAMYDASTGLFTIYKNGSPATGITAPASAVPGAVPRRNSKNLFIASPHFSNTPFQGLIDEITIYNRVLSPAEIQAIFQAGSAGKCKPQEAAVF